MAGKSNKLKAKKLQINFTDKGFYIFVIVISLIAISVGVYAAIPNPGHAITQIEPPSACAADQFLKWTDSAWTCASVAVNGGESLWIPSASNIYYNAGNVSIGGTSPGVPLEIAGGTDASGSVDTGFIEIDNSLRLDNNEIITNTGTTLYLQHDNNGNLRVDSATLVVNASANKVNIGGILFSSGPFHTTQYGIFEKGVIIRNNDEICSSDYSGMLRFRQTCTASSCSLYLEICTSLATDSWEWYALAEKYYTSINPPGPLGPAEVPDPSDIQKDCGPNYDYEEGFDYYWCTGCFYDPDCYNLDEQGENFIDACYELGDYAGSCD